ncbi:MAG: flagellar hook basal-body protein [Planctomycetota bacterium]
MNYGLYLSASGMLASTYRQDVATNNLANMNTVAFKVDVPTVRQRDAVRIEDGLAAMPSNELLERLGGGVQLAPNHIDFSQGDLTSSRNPLDLAIDGPGFFVMSQGTSGARESLVLSRDGRMTLSADGRLVSATSGMSVLSTSNQPIRLSPSEGPVMISGDGVVKQDGMEIARLRVADIADRSVLKKIGESIFEANASTVENLFQTDATVRQGFTEASGVNEIAAINAIRAASGAASTNAEMIRNHDRLMDMAISRLGRVA